MTWNPMGAYKAETILYQELLQKSGEIEGKQEIKEK